MNAIVKFSAAASLTMSSQEIAGLTGKELSNIHRDIRAMLVGLYGEEHVARIVPEQYRNRHSEFIRENADALLSAIAGDDSKRNHHDQRGFAWERDNRGYVVSFNLDYNHTLALISGYNVKLRKAIIDRWQQLEDQVTAPVLPKSLPEALRLAADLAEQKALAEQQRDEAIATKALIGSKREATAMATAAAAKREAHKLEVELDRSKMYASVKRVEREYPGQKINWRVMKRKSEEVGIPSIDVFDQNYGSVKAYHAEVWRKAYSIEIAQAKGAAHA